MQTGEEAADLIVLARLGAGREETVDGIDRTTVTAAVAATAKGAAPGRTVEVPCTTPGSGPETADLAEGKEYVLLLDAQDDGRFTLVNTAQGAYGVDGGRAVAGADNDVVLSAGVLKALRLPPLRDHSFGESAVADESAGDAGEGQEVAAASGAGGLDSGAPGFRARRCRAVVSPRGSPRVSGAC
ncbi:hypothetical protein [Kitasatospora albolonga]